MCIHQGIFKVIHINKYQFVRFKGVSVTPSESPAIGKRVNAKKR